MQVTRDQVLRVASLAHLSLTEDEVALYRVQLSAILAHAEILQRLDLESMTSTATASTLRNVVRSDVTAPSLSQSDALQNTPSVVDNHLKVKAVLRNG